ncbi:MAG TPA: bifunctional diaminohydroxyphosphoribosylaminopyrimidine deaminase/5-amino-6-(5-phosphoribosylamino)uracil reductase RibD [Fimbriimonadales bacterium]|nr:bifunctional diaminohydroxyphosphoribosylaminopyrimidine deaminase/5-amino-6-(5-phosphoribosylamino)uracil reductase RibD [Fimbriimonadales bacterium]
MNANRSEWTDFDSAMMREAIALSRMGFPAPNPRVGAIVVSNGEIVGRGHHEAVGLPHAEVVAIREAGERARGGVLYVTLEPCKHHGRTPPCVETIIASGIRRVVYACDDPNPMAAGGANVLREAGIEVQGGLLCEEAAKINRFFMNCHRLGRPWVFVKAGVTLDGRIATSSGESKWITDETARKRTHELRAETGCVLVGSKTVLCDNPSLTVRAFSVPSQPLRVILDLDASLRGEWKCFTDRQAKTIWVTSQMHRDYENEYVENWVCPLREGEFDLNALLHFLKERGMIAVLVEGGGNTVETFFRQSLADEIELHVAPKVLGSGRVWVDGKGVKELKDAWQLTDLHAEPLGDGLKITAKVKR